MLAARRRGLPVLSEIEIAWRIAEAEATGCHRWVAVTGTNGKSTTTAWIAEILRFGTRPVALAGNIGAPLSGFLGDRAPRDFVCELSSFQLETVERFRPDVAVLTNVTPDHLDRYATLEDYAATKERIFSNQRESDFAVVNADALLTLPPPDSTVHLTVVPEMGLPYASLTRTSSESGSCVPATVVCGLLNLWSVIGVPASAVARNLPETSAAPVEDAHGAGRFAPDDILFLLPEPG